MSQLNGALAILACAVIAPTLGCASSYVPRPSPRVSLVMEAGNMAYVRDGKRYEGGLFGGALDDAVHGNSQAEEYAREYRSGMTTGFLLSMVGLAGVVGGATVTGIEAENQTSGQSFPVTGLILIGAGAVVEIVGSIVMASAQPHLFDAINAYNDGILVPEPSATPPPAFSGTATPRAAPQPPLSSEP